MKILLLLLLHLLILVLMQTCSKAIALHSHDEYAEEARERRLVLEHSSTPQHTIPSKPYSRRVSDHAPSRVPRINHHPRGRQKKQHKKSFRHKSAPAIAVNPHDHHQSIAIPPSSVSPSTPYHKHYHLYPGHRHNNGHSKQGPSMPPSLPPFPSSPGPAASPPKSMPSFSPSVSPFPSINTKATPPSSPMMALPPPPPNTDCLSVTCTEPLTYTAAGSPCGCVQPIQVKLEVDVAIYAFFPLVSKLAEEIAAGVALARGQVRIIGADSATQLDKTAVLIDLVPARLRFGYVSAFRIYDGFWRRRVPINASIFGEYKVLYVHYPGLPPSPPPAPLIIPGTEDGGGMPMKPLGVDVSEVNRVGLGKRMIAAIAATSFAAFVVFSGAVWVLLAKLRSRTTASDKIIHPQSLIKPKPPTTRTRTMHEARTTSDSSKRTDTSTASVAPRAALAVASGESVTLSSGGMKVFTAAEMERATKGFEEARVVGEGGFGVVYKGTMDDGRDVAIKVLKRHDHQGGREFLAEVEMLSRVHHRNLVKLIGICTEGQARCLVYDLVPNGSVESHLHGVDKEGDPLDWEARMKIAVGAARGLAYLHEDSSPRVIHRDFKSSNILLEYDFTPKVSDFGLARSALEGHTQISTQVMGTFGYLAPEYAMTGHLLVKSDVYSYGVVLLELLTGRKPVDLSQPPGQENLVSWVRPLLTDREALPSLIDPSLGPGHLDTASKIAAIASMCVQPEVAHRPFMGEVVQALNLVCADFSDHLPEQSLVTTTTVDNDDKDNGNGNSNDDDNGNRGALLMSRSELLVGIGEGNDRDLGSFRRMYSSSGQLINTGGQNARFWQRLRSLSWGS